MLKFIKNSKPKFDISKIDLTINSLELDDENHYENQFIKGKDRHASIQNKVWNEDLPREIKNYLNEIGLKNETFTANINVQRPGQMAPLHKDNHYYAKKYFGDGEFDRILIFLTDWKIGQVFGCVDESITKWKAGDVFTFEDDDYHWSANTGMSDKYTIVISVMKDKFLKND